MESIKSTDNIYFLHKCFNISFIPGKYNQDEIEKYILPRESGMQFQFVEFVHALKSKNETLGLIPVDCFVESECSEEILKEIEKDFTETEIEGGFTRLFLEYLFDERFKNNFNSLVNEKIRKEKDVITDDETNYLSTKKSVSKGTFDYDLVGMYLTEIKKSYDAPSDLWDYSSFTEREEIRSKKDKNEFKTKLGVEVLNKNPYSAFKVYGQEVYSRILISISNNLMNNIKKSPKELSDQSTNVILNEPQIKEVVPSLNSSEMSEGKNAVCLRIYELEVEKIKYELQRFFDDYVPSDLDRVFVKDKSSKNYGEILRDLLIRDFRGLMKDEWGLYKKVNGNSFVYEKLSERRNLFSNYELGFIETTFNEKSEKDASLDNPNEFSFSEKIEYLMKNVTSEQKIWKQIQEKYKEYFPVSLEDGVLIEGDNGNLDSSEKEKFYGSKDINLKDTLVEILIECFNKNFIGENQFLASLEWDIKCLNINEKNLDFKKFFTNLKGAKDHPWGRFFTVYQQNCELNLYQKPVFTKVMNSIEKEVLHRIEMIGD